MWPRLALCGIGEKVHDDGALADCLVHLEKILAWDPAILYGLLPALTILSDTNNDIETVVTEVKTLTVTLRTVSDQGEGVILEVFLFHKVSYCVRCKLCRLME